jgi:REP element-mobilizing transposase RayT
MAVKTPIEFTEGMYFITFTCQHWLPLFEITNSYDTVYKWFDYLYDKGHKVKGYVIMPNHLHALIDFGASQKNINTIVSDGKRFMAYKIVERLKAQNKTEILLQLSEAVISSDRDKGKIHQVFERSFDCKEITSNHFFLQKLSYMHNNPCSGIWDLVKSPSDYEHSSAKYYISGEQGECMVKDE